MAEETIYCPSCNRKVRVPEEMLGQPVQCPLCHFLFVAPTRGPAPAGAPPAEPPLVQPAPVPPLVPSPLSQAPMPIEAERDVVTQLLRGPGMALLLLSILGWIANVAMVIKTKEGGPEGLREAVAQTRNMMDQIYPPGPERDRAQQMLTEEFVYNLQMTLSLVFLIVCTCSMIGAMQMLRQRGYWMAVLGSLLIMTNLSNCCCLAGIPVGIWSLSVLMRPEVRRAFE
jgi:hypothetical protein